MESLGNGRLLSINNYIVGKDLKTMDKCRQIETNNNDELAAKLHQRIVKATRREKEKISHFSDSFKTHFCICDRKINRHPKRSSSKRDDTVYVTGLY